VLASQDKHEVCSVFRYELGDEARNPRAHMIGCGNDLGEDSNKACILGGGSEKTFAYHVMRGNFTMRGFSELDKKLWSKMHAELMVWRHMVPSLSRTPNPTENLIA